MELLSHSIRECDDIKGIKIHDVVITVSQHADDTALLVDEIKEPLQRVMSLLRWFKNVSGLGINIDKTKFIKIWAYSDRSISWKGKYGMNWRTEFVVLGIKYDINSLETITLINIEKKITNNLKLI